MGLRAVALSFAWKIFLRRLKMGPLGLAHVTRNLFVHLYTILDSF